MFIPIVVIIAALILKQLTAPDFVYMCGGFYKTDCEKLDLDCHYKSYSDFGSLKFFPSLDYLYISDLKTDKKISMPYVSVSEICLGGCDIKNTSFFGSLENTKQMWAFKSKMDLSDFSNESFEGVNFVFCKMDNFEQFGTNLNAEELYIYGCEFTGTEKTSAFNSEMHDSSVFAAFDKVKILKIYNTKIDDISGFTEMQELQEMHFWADGDITDEQVAELENAGITVYLENPAYSHDS